MWKVQAGAATVGCSLLAPSRLTALPGKSSRCVARAVPELCLDPGVRNLGRCGRRGRPILSSVDPVYCNSSLAC